MHEFAAPVNLVLHTITTSDFFEKACEKWHISTLNLIVSCAILAPLYWQQKEMNPCLSLIGILNVCASVFVILGNKMSANTASRDLFPCWQKRRNMWWLLWSKRRFKEVLSVDGFLFLYTRTSSKIFHPFSSLVLP